MARRSFAGVIGLQTPADYLVLTQRLMAEGLTAKHLRRLWAGNFIRVMSRVQYAGLKQSRHSDDEGDDNDNDSEAADILNECGWDIEVVPDTLALTKLSTSIMTNAESSGSGCCMLISINTSRLTASNKKNQMPKK